MGLVLAFVGYAMFLYGWEVTGCIVMGLGAGAFWAETRLTARGERSTIDEPIDQPMKEIPPR